MKRIFFTYFLNIIIICIVILAYVNFIYQPAQKIIKTKIQNEFKNEMTLKSYLIDNAVSRFIEGAKSISSRSMIRKKIVEYKQNKISFDELSNYTKPKYIDGVKALDACIYATRYVDDQILVEYGDSSSYKLNRILPGMLNIELNALVDVDDTILNVCVISPIKQEQEILGYDILYSKCSKVLHEILHDNQKFSIISFKQDRLLPMSADQIQQNAITSKKDYIYYVSQSNYADIYYCFAKSEESLYQELYQLQKRHIVVIILLTISISLILVIMQQRAKLLFFKKSKYLENLVSEKTVELNKAIHKLKNSNSEITESKKQLQNLNATKDKFFSIIAHDLMSPFNSMLGFSDILVHKYNDLDRDKQKQYINNIHKSIHNTYSLLENILTWSRSQRNNISVNFIELNLFSIANETINLLVQRAEKKNIQVNNLVQKGVAVFADKDMLKTVLRNLISNAIKFTYEEGKIDLSAKKLNINNNEFIEVSVSDDGMGIKPELLKKIFDLSESISTKGTNEESGTGLGLVICKEFVEKNGGEIWVESELGAGSQFKFTLLVS